MPFYCWVRADLSEKWVENPVSSKSELVDRESTTHDIIPLPDLTHRQ
jgi:hypothetical protein